MDVTLPDGTVINGVPDGTTKAQLAQKLQANGYDISKLESQPAPPQSALEKFTSMSRSLSPMGLGLRTFDRLAGKYIDAPIKNLVGGTVEPVLQQASGFMAKPIGELAGIGAMAADATGAIPNNPEQVQNTVQNALTYKPMTAAGQNPNNVLNAIPRAIGRGINAIQPPPSQDPSSFTGMAQNALREAVPQAVNIATAAAPKALQAANANKIAASTRAGFAPDVADAQHFMDEGLKIAPHEIKTGNPNNIAKIIEGVSNEKRIGDTVSQHNQPVFNEIARKDIGIPTGDRITPEALAEKRLEAYKPYDAITQFGKDVNLKFKFDSTLFDDLNNITKKITNSALAEERPNASTIQMANRAVANVRQDILGEGKNTAQLSPDATIGLIKSLREESANLYAKKEMTTEDIQIAKVKYESANALERMVERRLTQSGSPQLVSEFRAARTQLAKLHTYGEILNPFTGNLAVKQLSSKRYAGEPFSGGLGELRKFATKYKDSSKPEAQQRAAGVSPVEAALAVTGHALKSPLHTAIIGGRIAARSTLISNPIQRSLAQYPKSGNKVMPFIGAAGMSAPTNANPSLSDIFNRYNQNQQ